MHLEVDRLRRELAVARQAVARGERGRLPAGEMLYLRLRANAAWRTVETYNRRAG